MTLLALHCRWHCILQLALRFADGASHTATSCLQEKDQTLERATQEALDASGSAEHQHRALAKQLAEEREQLQERSAQVQALPVFAVHADTIIETDEHDALAEQLALEREHLQEHWQMWVLPGVAVHDCQVLQCMKMPKAEGLLGSNLYLSFCLHLPQVPCFRVE